jgi:hypothetical protein
MTYDRAAIMRDAHKQFSQMKRLGDPWAFSRCLAYAWAKAKGRRLQPIAARRYNPPVQMEKLPCLRLY